VELSLMPLGHMDLPVTLFLHSSKFSGAVVAI
jgi:hypothetical protein